MQNTLNKVFPDIYIWATFTEYIKLKKVQFKKKKTTKLTNKTSYIYTRCGVTKKIMIIN